MQKEMSEDIHLGKVDICWICWMAAIETLDHNC